MSVLAYINIKTHLESKTVISISYTVQYKIQYQVAVVRSTSTCTGYPGGGYQYHSTTIAIQYGYG